METIVFGLGHTDTGIKITSDCVHSFYTHTHVYHEMLFYQPFDGFITVNDQKLPVDTEMVLLLTPNDFHSTTVEGETKATYLKIAFRGDIIPACLADELAQPIILQLGANDALLCALLERLSRAQKHSLERQSILLSAFLAELTDKGKKLGISQKKGTKLLVLDATRMINEHFYESISLASVAQSLNVSPQHLSTTFAKQMGVGFSTYLRDKRLKYAADLLAERKWSTTEVCYRCGFENLSHFLRCFKKKYGVTPKNYNNQRSLP